MPQYNISYVDEDSCETMFLCIAHSQATTVASAAEIIREELKLVEIEAADAFEALRNVNGHGWEATIANGGRA